MEIAEGLDEVRVEGDLLVRFPHCGGKGGRIIGFDLAAGKGDLSGMRSQMRRPLGQ
jgi:hypothetical protein